MVNGIGRQLAGRGGTGGRRSRLSLLRSSGGFTIVELGITLAVVAIIAVLAGSSFMTMLRRNRISTAAREFVAAANLARSEAIRRGGPVTLCRSADGLSHAPAGNLDQGWIVFADPDGDATVDAGDEILQVHRAIGGGTTMIGPADPFITYNSRGVPTTGAANITVTNTSDTSRAVGIALSTTGRFVLTKIVN